MVLCVVLLFVIVSAYPPPVQIKDEIQILQNVTKNSIIQNHMKYTKRDTNRHGIPIYARVAKYHERTQTTLPIFAHKFKGIFFEEIVIRSINDKIVIQDNNPYKKVVFNASNYVVLKTELDYITFSEDIYRELWGFLSFYQGVLFDSTIPTDFVVQATNKFPKMFDSFKLITTDDDPKPFLRICKAVFIDTQFYDKRAVSYQPLQPLAWIENSYNLKFDSSIKNGGFVLDFEGKTYCKHSTTHTANTAFLLFIKKLNVTFTYHKASHEHSCEAEIKSDKFMDDFCTTNYPTPFSINEKLGLAQKINCSVLCSDFGAALDFFFDVL
ncbi:hypothetical protein EIN_344870 [Entamoeba invadens IP1]|uniref:Uncharacterized protein n=1 Tax=Entamoeba invadens IP1 TaxID=370355 RepID=A0A0A1U3B0_ENTIV|nr:hypothetical protein EIN_344870 [Entamoeba invadens IP1]ELP88527.1 hypothetical protein EIN_344870 [Entamoeba invadens IP1]|eukprot:XP_004255298.1 hypothetical protein EIN_344870 [Entamoeba invadens IP1]